MSSRVRIIGSHPAYGVCWGGNVVHCIEDSWNKKSRMLVATFPIRQPLDYAGWPRWKRTLWMAKQEGNWFIKVFREPRGARMSRSQYGKAFTEYGLIPPKRRLWKKDAKKKLGNKPPAQGQLWKWGAQVLQNPVIVRNPAPARADNLAAAAQNYGVPAADMQNIAPNGIQYEIYRGAAGLPNPFANNNAYQVDVVELPVFGEDL